MLNELQARGERVARTAADRARRKVAVALREALPGIYVTIDDDRIVLFGTLDVDDERLRWIGRMLR